MSLDQSDIFKPVAQPKEMNKISSFIHSADRFLGMETGSDQSDNEVAEVSEIEIRYHDGNSGHAEQYFECRNYREHIGNIMDGLFNDIQKYSCKVNVTLTLGDDADSIKQIKSTNGHLFIPDPPERGITKSFMNKNPHGFFTCKRDILIYKTNENDNNDVYVYALSHTPPNPNPNMNAGSRTNAFYGMNSREPESV